MEFQAITTQEELDRVIGDRLKRERETASKKYADYDELKSKVAAYEKQLGELNSSFDETNKKTEEYEKTINELTGKNKTYELASLKARIAHEKGIPYELAGRLTGEDEESLKADAESLSKLIAVTGKQPAPPLKDTEPSKGKDDPYKALLNGLKGE